MFIAESMLGCAGQIDPPEGYLPKAYEYARHAGAVVVADEVQLGFGRVGSHYWAFEAHGARPDIVTFGKPIGNGFPLGAVVTTREIAASFANGMEYFNTFGGSPAACAAGLAVLDVLGEDGLLEHARNVGRHLADGFRALATRHEAIGDVRGRGLFLGVDLVQDRSTRAPATGLAGDLVETLRKEAILLSTEGPGDNVLKIKPPLSFSTADADRLIDAVDRYLGKVNSTLGPSRA
jgi:4-aminobutyrate aminotransferase-like enzyme